MLFFCLSPPQQQRIFEGLYSRMAPPVGGPWVGISCHLDLPVWRTHTLTPHFLSPYHASCEQRISTTTCRYERLAVALQLYTALYSALQRSTALYSALQRSTALHPLQYTSLYNTPQICRRVRERRRDGDACEHAAVVHSYVLRTVVACVVFSRILEL